MTIFVSHLVRKIGCTCASVLRRLERKAEPEQNDLFRIDKAQQRIWYQQKALTLRQQSSVY
jgi:hypothetical protein